MQLKNEISGRNALRKIIQEHYRQQNVEVNIFWESDENGFFNVHFLIDRKHVARYGIGEHRSTSIGGVQLAIGPHYFSPENFCSHEYYQKFSIDSGEDTIKKNLHLLDLFLNNTKSPQSA